MRLEPRMTTMTIDEYFQEVADALTDGNLDDLEFLLGTPVGRRYATLDEPLLFALTYLPHSLKMPAPLDEVAGGADSEVGIVSMSEFHWDLCEKAAEWAEKPASQFGPAEIGRAHV